MENDRDGRFFKVGTRLTCFLPRFAQNYGAIVARVALQPTEEAARLSFARLQDRRGEDDDDATAQLRLARLLGTLLRAMAYVGLVFAGLGAPFAPLAVRLLKGAAAPPEDLRASGAVLGAYCLYVPFLAINGVSEAFAHAVGDDAELRGLAAAHAACALLFAAVAGPALRGSGPPGLVFASAAAMAVRAAANLALARRKLRGADARSALAAAATPDAAAVAVFAVAAAAARRSANHLAANHGPDHALAAAAPHVAVGAAAGVAVLLGLARDRAFFRDAARLFRDKGD